MSDLQKCDSPTGEGGAVGTGAGAPNEKGGQGTLVADYTARLARIRGWRVAVMHRGNKIYLTGLLVARDAADVALELARKSPDPLHRGAYVETIPLRKGSL